MTAPTSRPVESCSHCGAALAPGSTFCRACGEGVAERVAPLPGQRPARRDAAVLLVAIASLFTLYVGSMLVLRRFHPQAEALVAPALSAAIALPLARGLWIGATWARPVSLLVAAVFTGFCGWLAMSLMPAFGTATTQDAWYVADVVFFLVQGAIGAGTAFVLLRKT